MMLASVNIFAQNRQQLELARAYEAGGDMKNAARIYIEQFEANNASTEAYEGMVRSMTAINQYAGLLPLIEKRFQVTSSQAVAFDAAVACFKTGKIAEADGWWKKAVQIGRESEGAWAEAARRQASLLDNQRAVESYLVARSKSSFDAAYSLQLAALYSTMGNVKAAAAEILLLHSEDRELAATYGRLSALMTSDSNANIVLEVIQAKTSVPDIDYITQWYYRHTGQWAKALSITEEIDKRSNPRGTELLRFADAARSEGAFDVAIDAYGRLMGPNADKRVSLSAAYGYALTLDLQLRSYPVIDKEMAKKAIERYREIISNYPDHPLCADALYHAAVLTDEVLHDADGARDMLTRLTNRWRGTTAAVDGSLVLANLYIAAGQDDAAFTTLTIVENDKNAVHADRRDVARMRKGDLQLFRGKRDSARAVYAALAATPGSVAANDALDRITLLMLEQDDSVGVNGFIRGLTSLARRDGSGAARIFVATAESASDPEIKDRCRISAAKVFISLDNHLAADSQLVLLLDRVPETSYGDQALVLAADLMEMRGDKQGAVTALTSLLVQYPKSILAPSARERIRRLRGDA